MPGGGMRRLLDEAGRSPGADRGHRTAPRHAPGERRWAFGYAPRQPSRRPAGPGRAPGRVRPRPAAARGGHRAEPGWRRPRAPRGPGTSVEGHRRRVWLPADHASGPRPRSGAQGGPAATRARGTASAPGRALWPRCRTRDAAAGRRSGTWCRSSYAPGSIAPREAKPIRTDILAMIWGYLTETRPSKVTNQSTHLLAWKLQIMGWEVPGMHTEAATRQRGEPHEPPPSAD